jgi:hypothetical protein
VWPLFFDIDFSLFISRFGFSRVAIAKRWRGMLATSILQRATSFAVHRSSANAKSRFDEFREHLLRVDGDEESFAAGEHFPFFVQDFGHIYVLATLDSNLARFHQQRLS